MHFVNSSEPVIAVKTGGICKDVLIDLVQQVVLIISQDNFKEH